MHENIPVQTLVPPDWGKTRLRRFTTILPSVLYEYVMLPDGRRELVFVGPKCRELLELNEKDLLADASLFEALVLDEDLQRVKDEDVAANREGKAFTSEFRIRTRSGCIKWIHLSSRPNPATETGIVVWSGFMIDITESKQMQERVRQLAFYDALTHLPNRRLLVDRLTQSMSASDRNGIHGSLMVLDLDNFKTINDQSGHLVGDALLVEAAARLKNSVRAEDTVARFGGDEFVVMLSELSIDEDESKRIAGQVAEKIRVTLAEPFMLTVQHEGRTDNYVQHCCTASIGVTLYRGNSVDLEKLIGRADTAMYHAKQAGRNQVWFYGNDCHQI